MVILKNTRRQPFIFSMYHGEVCRRARKCTCVTKMVPGENGKPVPTYYPMSVQIDALMESGPLPNEVYHVPQVKSAVEAGRLKRTFVDQPKAAAAPKVAVVKPSKKGKE